MSHTAKNTDLSAVAMDAKNRMSSDIDSLKEDIAQMRADIMHVLERALGIGKARAANVAKDVKSRLTHLKDAGEEEVGALSERIEEHPLAATAVAFGIGFLVAKVMRHRK